MKEPVDTFTYKISDLVENLYNGNLGIDMGIHPVEKRKLLNKEKANRRKKRSTKEQKI